MADRLSLVDILEYILQSHHQEDVMERINLNVPEEARRELKRAAKRMGRTEAEVARMLVLEGLERLARNEFFDAVAAARTPKLVKRELEILEMLERLDGPAR